MNILQKLQNLRSEKRKGFAVLVDPDKEFNFSFEPSFPAPEFLLLGGSLLVNRGTDSAVAKIRNQTDLPIALFPGNSFQISDKADAVLFLSLISGRNADLLIGQQVIAAPFIKASGMEVVPTGYMLVDSGRMTTAHYMSGTLPLPANKPEIAASTALAGEMLGLQCLYADAGSGAEHPVPATLIRAIREAVDLPLIVGGGLRNPESIRQAFEAGADLVVIGTAFENENSALNGQEIRNILTACSANVRH